MEICPNCLKDLKDYGGYKAKMNPKGVSLTDVWVDIPPVRHHKYKKRKGANELSIKLLDRIIEMASKEGDHVFDPFGGSGSTYAVAEIKKRRWTGIEIGPVSEIIERLKNPKVDEDHLLRIRAKSNFLFTPKDKERREKLGLWTHETIRNGGLKSEKNGSESSLKNLSQNDLPFN
jgi:site-specific DNA-methyltransferase (adenine-specific)